MHFVDHGVVGVDVLPQALLCLAVQVDHFLDVHDVVLDQVHHVAAGLVLYIIIDGDIGVILVPGQCVAEQAPVGDGGKMGVQLVELGVVPGDAPHITGGRHLGGDLPVLDVVGDLVGDDLPPQVVVQRDGVGVEQGKALALLVHLGQALDHEPLHDAVAGVLRVGTHTGHKAHMVNGVVDVHLQRVDRELRDKVFSVKAAQHVRALQHGDIQMSVLATNNFMPFAPSCGWLNMPYLFGSLEEFRKLVDLMWDQHNAWAVKESGARVLAIVDIGYRQLTTDAAHPVRNLADARGVTVRTPQSALAVSAFNALGFKPHPASFADTYGMLAKGTVSGQEGCFNNVVTMKFADHQKYATCINYAVHSANIIVNEEWLQSLPEQARDALIRAGREAMAYERTKVSQMLVADDRALQEQGMELLGVVEDLSEWTRLGRTSWLKCYDVLGYGDADKGKAIMAVVLSKKEALANAWEDWLRQPPATR